MQFESVDTVDAVVLAPADGGAASRKTIGPI